MSARWKLRAALVVLAAGLASCAPAPSRPWVVGTSGDYAPFSVARSLDPFVGVDGFDLAVARVFADGTGRALQLRRFLWTGLASDVRAGAFDVAMSGVTIRPERSVRGRFSVPVATSGAVVLTGERMAADGLAGLDRPEVRIAVNRGGHLERVARRRFPSASLVPMPENDAVRRALSAGDVDALVTDTLEAPHWQASLPGVTRLGPFTRDRKAYLWRNGAEREARDLDAWLLAREADGTLAALRARHFAVPGPATATPDAALLAAMGERLALMPSVAEAKRGRGGGVRDVPREARVLDAALAAVSREAARLGRAAPPRTAVEAFYRAQIEAAVDLQRRVLSHPPTGAPPFDLADELRPALLRIGDRMAWLLVRLERAPSPGELVQELADFDLDPGHAHALAAALDAIVRGRVAARASSPAIPSPVAVLDAFVQRVAARASSPAITGSASETP